MRYEHELWASNCWCDRIFNLKFKLLVYRRMEGEVLLGTPDLIISISIGFLSKLDAAASCGFRFDASRLRFGFPLEFASFNCLVFFRRFSLKHLVYRRLEGSIVAREREARRSFQWMKMNVTMMMELCSRTDYWRIIFHDREFPYWVENLENPILCRIVYWSKQRVQLLHSSHCNARITIKVWELLYLYCFDCETQ